MATILSFLSGRQITNDSGVPQTGAKVYHYRATTTTNLTVWQNADGTGAHAQPVVCDAGGFVPLIYVDDTFNWKIVVTTSADVTLPQYNFDNLQKAVAEQSSAGFTPPFFPWTQVTSTTPTVTLAAADAGNAYEGDTTSGNIEFDLPSAASAGDGKGFAFKKTAAANSLDLDPAGAETIDGQSSLRLTALNETVYIVSNGANWYTLPERPAFRLLESGSVSAATLDIVLTRYTAYRGLKFVLQLTPATDGATLRARTSTDGGANYDAGATDYSWASQLWFGNAGAGDSDLVGDDSDAEMDMTGPIGNATTEGVHAIVELWGQTGAVRWGRIRTDTMYVDNTATPLAVRSAGGGTRKAAADIDAIRFLFSAGNIVGDYAVYGYA